VVRGIVRKGSRGEFREAAAEVGRREPPREGATVCARASLESEDARTELGEVMGGGRVGSCGA
jgi:hypothetical protein